MTDNKNIISEKLKGFFKEKKLRQKDIAQILNVSQENVSAYLNGKPFGKNNAKTWGDAFEIQPTWLLTGEGPMLKSNQFVKQEPQENTTEKLLDLLKKKDEQIDRLITIIERYSIQNVQGEDAKCADAAG